MRRRIGAATAAAPVRRWRPMENRSRRISPGLRRRPRMFAYPILMAEKGRTHGGLPQQRQIHHVSHRCSPGPGAGSRAQRDSRTARNLKSVKTLRLRYGLPLAQDAAPAVRSSNAMANPHDARFLRRRLVLRRWAKDAGRSVPAARAANPPAPDLAPPAPPAAGGPRGGGRGTRPGVPRFHER